MVRNVCGWMQCSVCYEARHTSGTSSIHGHILLGYKCMPPMVSDVYLDNESSIDKPYLSDERATSNALGKGR